MSRFVLIDSAQLSAEALQGLMEEYVSRDGTDYGFVELTLDEKCQQLRKAIESKLLHIVFDTDTEMVDLIGSDLLKEFGHH